MCGIAFAQSLERVDEMLHILAHRGRDARRISQFNSVFVGFNRLAIVDVNTAVQPLNTEHGITVFNGEIFNQEELLDALVRDDNKMKPVASSEVAIIDCLMRRYPSNFQRFLDGYFAIIRFDKDRRIITLARDVLGVMPLYYCGHGGKFRAASELKALSEFACRVFPGHSMRFTTSGELLQDDTFDPWSLHMEPLRDEHMQFLFERAVHRRLTHSEVPVTVALSGGLDSSLVLAACKRVAPDFPIDAITVAFDENSDELSNAVLLCKRLGVKHKWVRITEQMMQDERERILYHLEDPHENPIKRAAMVRNYFTAKHATGKVILCGEGADELGCGYPSHLRLSGIDMVWKSLSTLRTMHVINLDRVNKGGMAFTKEFRTPFLDRALALYVMGCAKEPNKAAFRRLASRYGIPREILEKSKYGNEESTLWRVVKEW